MALASGGSSGLLRGVRVLDLSRILAGPWATQLLADLGAEVIKVERPGVGDDTRAWGPPFYGDGEHRAAAYFTCCNRGKRSITVDFRQEQGREIVRALTAHSDVVFENFLPGTLDRLGLGFRDLERANARVILVSISGFGQHGPRKHEAGYDFMAQGMSGLMSITGLNNEPVKTGVAVVDVMTGLYASTAALAALHARAHQPGAQHIDLSLLYVPWKWLPFAIQGVAVIVDRVGGGRIMLGRMHSDVSMAMLANQASNYLATGRSPGTAGNGHPNIAPYDVVRAADLPFILAVGNDAQFQKVCDLLGQPELARDERYRTNALRVAHRAELLPALNAVFATRSAAAWLEQLRAAGVPCGPVNDIGRAFADPHSVAHELRRSVPYDYGELEHGDEHQRIDTVANPIRLDTGRESLSQSSERGIPALGAHTTAVLREVLGYSEQQIRALREAHVV